MFELYCVYSDTYYYKEVAASYRDMILGRQVFYSEPDIMILMSYTCVMLTS